MADGGGQINRVGGDSICHPPSAFRLPSSLHMRFLIALSLLALQAPSGALSLQQRLQQRLDSLHRAGHFAGAQIGVALPDGSTITVATGSADTAKGEAMTTRHLLLQGSVGKTYASAVAMQLLHEGKIALGDPISKYLASEPWFSRLPNAQAIFRYPANRKLSCKVSSWGRPEPSTSAATPALSRIPNTKSK